MLRGLPDDDATVHGLRANFRTWAAEVTDYPREIAEAALGHRVGDDVERAYARTTFFEKRKALMEQWADFTTTSGRKVASAYGPDEGGDGLGEL